MEIFKEPVLLFFGEKTIEIFVVTKQKFPLSKKYQKNTILSAMAIKLW